MPPVAQAFAAALPSASTLRLLAPSVALAVAAAGCAVLAARSGGPGVAALACIASASLISAIAGFAFSAICGAMLFHLWDDQVQVVQVMIACSIANQVVMTWSVRRDVQACTVGVFLLGGIAGLPIGVWALLHADHALYTRALGALLLAYGAYMLTCRPRTVAWQRPGLDLLAGALGGISGGAAGFPGAPVTIWCGLKGWDKARQRALFQPFILLMQVAALLAISAVRPRAGGTGGLDPAIMLCLPAGLLGTSLGMACFRRMSNRQFTLAVNVLLIASGLSYLL